MVLALDRQLTKYYWHSIPKEAGFPFLALVEHTNYMSPEHYGGDHLVYVGDYLDPSHEYFKLSAGGAAGALPAGAASASIPLSTGAG